MSRGQNTIKTSQVSITPILLKYSSSFSSSSFSANGITVNRGTNSSLSSDSANFSNYALVRQLYYQEYLTGSLNFSSSYWNGSLQSTAASGTLDDDNRYFPAASGSEITIIGIPRTVFGEQISRGSLRIAASTYNLIDDGNGNVIDSNNSYVHVGNVLYSQGVIVLTNQDYRYCMIDSITPTTTTTTTSTTTTTTTAAPTTTTTTSTTTAAPTTTTTTTTSTTTVAPTTTTTTSTTTVAPTTTTTTSTTTVAPTTTTTTSTTTAAPTTTTSTTTTTTTAGPTTTTTLPQFSADIDVDSESEACNTPDMTSVTISGATDVTAAGANNITIVSQTSTFDSLVGNNGFFWVAQTIGSDRYVRYYQRNGTNFTAVAQNSAIICGTTTTTSTTTTTTTPVTYTSIGSYINGDTISCGSSSPTTTLYLNNTDYATYTSNGNLISAGMTLYTDTSATLLTTTRVFETGDGSIFNVSSGIVGSLYAAC